MHWQYCIVAPVYYYFLVGSSLLHVFFSNLHLTLTKFWKPFAGRFLAVYLSSGIYSFVEAVFGFWKTVWNSRYLSPIVCMFFLENSLELWILQQYCWRWRSSGFFFNLEPSVHKVSDYSALAMLHRYTRVLLPIFKLDRVCCMFFSSVFRSKFESYSPGIVSREK